MRYIAFADPGGFQPANISFGLLPPASEELKRRMRDRKERHRFQVEQALEAMELWIDSLHNGEGAGRQCFKEIVS